MTVKNLTTTATTYPYQKAFWILSYALLVLVAMYLYFVSTTISSVVKLDHLRNEFGALQSSVNELESDYVALSDKVTIDLAHELGYQDAASRSSFAYETEEASGVALSYNR